MTINEAVPLRSTIAARLDRLGWSPFHTRLVAGFGCRNNGGLGPQRPNLKWCRIGLHWLPWGRLCEIIAVPNRADRHRSSKEGRS